ncbi:MAG TPA: hypothetical protein VJR92_11460 [Gemmatimonadaceae bacterium]|nr:hypothetical protein [Gemmatimonadaceae bacterium]
MKTALAIIVAAVAFSSERAAEPKFEKIHALGNDEGVFAYARISPDARFLAYASQERDTRDPAPMGRTVNVVDLKTHKVTFTESGIDAYWSNDSQRMIYLSAKEGAYGVTIRNNTTGQITRSAAPADLGDYYSWAVRDGKNLILTIQSNYYFLDGDHAAMPHSRVPACPGIGTGERPLISKDGQRISTFVRGNVVIRGLDNCENTFDTGLPGAKTDFSFDGRYIAMHVQKPNGARGYEIRVIDLKEKTVRTVTNFAGSSLFPSWTKDGRLMFMYDGQDYRGFMLASDVLSVPAQPLPPATQRSRASTAWRDVFPETPQPKHRDNVVLVWATWSAHSPQALTELERARDYFVKRGADVGVVTTVDPGTRAADAAAMQARYGVDLPRIPLAPERLGAADAQNQMPTTLLFRDGVLVDRKLGAQTFAELRDWVLRGAGN